MMRFSTLFAVGVALSGCVPTSGANFTRPSDDKLVSGQTTPADIKALLGQPQAQRVMTVQPRTEEDKKTLTAIDPDPSGRVVTLLTYFYKKGIPKREAAFFFADDKLSQVIFFSDFPEDSTNYDDSKVSLLVKGKTTEDQAIEYFGHAGGLEDYPTIRDKTSHALMYDYGSEGPKSGIKELLLLFDKNRILQDYKFKNNIPP